ncbi:hypothetical protein H1C71_004599, partial [Ictidomys tridecemlineatus]
RSFMLLSTLSASFPSLNSCRPLGYAKVKENDFSKVTQQIQDPGFPAFGPVPFPRPPEGRKRRSWGCKDVEEQKERRGLGKRGGVRPAEARLKEGRMERRAARPAG